MCDPGYKSQLYMTFRAGTQNTVHARQPPYQHTIAVAIINTSFKKKTKLVLFNVHKRFA